MAAAVLADRTPHAGKTYLVSGPPRTLHEVAAAFTTAFGRRVEYAPISRDRFRSTLAKLLPDNRLVVDHLTTL